MKKFTVVFVVALLFAVIGIAHADTLHVPSAYPTIQAAINAASDLVVDTVQVAPGVYFEMVAIEGKHVNLIGSGSGVDSLVDTIIAHGIHLGSSADSGGTSATDRLVIKDLRVTGAPASAIELARATVNVNYVTLENLALDGNSNNGVELHFGTINDLIIKDCDITGNNIGVRMSTSVTVNGLTIDGCDIHDNSGAGLYGDDLDELMDQVTGIRVIDSEFRSNGYNSSSNADIVLTGLHGDATFDRVTVISDRSDTGIRISGSKDHSFSSPRPGRTPAGVVKFKDVTIQGTQGNAGSYLYPGAALAISRYTDASNVSFENVLLQSTAPYGLHLGTLDGEIDISGMTFDGAYGSNIIYLGTHGHSGSYTSSTVSVDATGATFVGISYEDLEDYIWHQVDDAGLGNVLFLAAPKAIKEGAMDSLNAVVCDDKKIRKDIADAIKHINKSLEDNLWIDDLHVDPKHGHKVFDEEKKAVKKLMHAIKEIEKKDACDLAKAACEDAINALIMADDMLVDNVMVEVEDALAGLDEKTAKKVDKEIQKVIDELEKVEKELDSTKKHGPNYDKAIDHLKHAWEHAQHALKAALNPGKGKGNGKK